MKHVHAELIKAWADGAEIECLATSGTWTYVSNPAWHKDISYRIKDPYAALKAAAKDPTKQIRVVDEEWPVDGEPTWSWCYPPEDYEIRDKPKAKVKMWLWLHKNRGGRFFATTEFKECAPDLSTHEVVQRLDWSMIEVEEP